MGQDDGRQDEGRGRPGTGGSRAERAVRHGRARRTAGPSQGAGQGAELGAGAEEGGAEDAVIGGDAIDDALKQLARPDLYEPLPYGWVSIIWHDYEVDRRKARPQSRDPSEKKEK